MAASVLPLGLALVLAGNPAPESAADGVTLRDGSVILGQVVDPSPRGGVAVMVRRAWAEVNLPDRAKRWETEEGPALRRAIKQRRDRLEAWKRQRAASAEPGDRILAWIDRELGRLGGAEPPRSLLMVVTVPRGDVRGITRRPKSSARLLRLGWRTGLPEPETMAPGVLRNGLEARGFDLSSTAPVGIDDLLPLAPESEEQWLARRAATEVTHDTGLKFLRVGPLIVPEVAPGQPVGPGLLAATLPNVSKLIDGKLPDPLPERLREVAARGRVGAVVTRQEMSPGLDAVRVELTLWVRKADGRWLPYGSRWATARTADAKDEEIKALESSGEIQTVFSVVKSLGLGVEVPGDVKRAGLGMGVATQKALGRAREAFQNDLANLALSVERGR